MSGSAVLGTARAWIPLTYRQVGGAWLGAVAWRQVLKAGNTVHLLVIVLSVAYFLQMASIVCELMHLMVYTRDGKGLKWEHSWAAADFWSEALENLVLLLKRGNRGFAVTYGVKVGEGIINLGFEGDTIQSPRK